MPVEYRIDKETPYRPTTRTISLVPGPTPGTWNPADSASLDRIAGIGCASMDLVELVGRARAHGIAVEFRGDLAPYIDHREKLIWFKRARRSVK